MPSKQTFFAEIKEGKLQLCKGQKVPYDAWVSVCKDKQVVRMQLQEQKHPKTHAQLAYYHAVILPFVRDELLALGHDTLFDSTVCGFSVGVATTNETVDLLLKALFMHHKQENKLPLKRNMTDEVMSELIDFTIRWVAEKLQVAVPPPTGAE